MEGKVIFKEYGPNRLTFLPYKLEESVPAGGYSGTVDQFIPKNKTGHSVTR
ncbi:hypothetical protein ABID99_003597 [Mucilaginibacter sp. OAE612]